MGEVSVQSVSAKTRIKNQFLFDSHSLTQRPIFNGENGYFLRKLFLETLAQRKYVFLTHAEKTKKIATKLINKNAN